MLFRSVRTTVPLTDAERTALASRLGSALGGKLGSAMPQGGSAARGEPVKVVLDEVVDKDLLGGFVAEIGDAYGALVDADLNRARARVRTTVPLTDAERTALASRLGTALGGMNVALDEVVDKNLLGGFVAEIGSLIVDGSLDGQLARLKERLARG